MMSEAGRGGASGVPRGCLGGRAFRYAYLAFSLTPLLKYDAYYNRYENICELLVAAGVIVKPLLLVVKFGEFTAFFRSPEAAREQGREEPARCIQAV